MVRRHAGEDQNIQQDKIVNFSSSVISTERSEWRDLKRFLGYARDGREVLEMTGGNLLLFSRPRNTFSMAFQKVSGGFAARNV